MLSLTRIPVAGAARIRRRAVPRLWQQLVGLVQRRDELGAMLACAGTLAWILLIGAALSACSRPEAAPAPETVAHHDSRIMKSIDDDGIVFRAGPDEFGVVCYMADYNVRRALSCVQVNPASVPGKQ